MKAYVPRPGSIAERALVILKDGQIRVMALADKLGVDRNSLFYTGMKMAIDRGVVVKTEQSVPGSNGRIETHYSLPGRSDDVDDAPPIRILVTGPGRLLVGAEVIAASNPFALAWENRSTTSGSTAVRLLGARVPASVQ